MSQALHIFTTGGTIDKIYFDALSEFAVGDSLIEHILKQAHTTVDYTITSLMKKDSLELTDADRQCIHDAVAQSHAQRILITHGTDTMPETATHLQDINNKCIVLCGSMQPARMQESDAAFNIGAALIATQTLSPGVYIVMSGQVFEAGKVRKNREQKCFEALP